MSGAPAGPDASSSSKVEAPERTAARLDFETPALSAARPDLVELPSATASFGLDARMRSAATICSMKPSSSSRVVKRLLSPLRTCSTEPRMAPAIRANRTMKVDKLGSSGVLD